MLYPFALNVLSSIMEQLRVSPANSKGEGTSVFSASHRGREMKQNARINDMLYWKCLFLQKLPIKVLLNVERPVDTQFQGFLRPYVSECAEMV